MKLTRLPRMLSLAGLFLFAFSIPISFVPCELGIGLAMIGWLLEGVLNHHWQTKRHVLFIPLGFYLAWNLFASAISARPAHSLWALADNEWPMFVMLMLFWTVNDLQTLKRIVYTFLATSTVAMVYAIWQSFGGVELWRNMPLTPMGGFYRAVGFNGFYLTFGAFAMSVFFLSVNLWIEGKEHKLPHAVVAVLSFLAVVGTFARSIWLSFFVAIPIFGFVRSRKLGSVVTTGFVALAIAAVIFVPTIRERAASIIDVQQNETRLNLWRTSLNMFRAYPVTGVGEDNFDFYFDQFRVEGYYDVTVHPHNDYLNVLVSSGVPGLAAFVAIWIVAVTTGFRTWRRSKDRFVRGIAMGGTLGVVGFLVGSCFQDYYGTFANCWGWWFITGLVFVANKLGEKEGEDQTIT